MFGGSVDVPECRSKLCGKQAWPTAEASSLHQHKRHLLQLRHALPSRSTGRQVAAHQKRFLTGRLLRTLSQLCSQVCFFGLRWHRAALVAVHGAMGVRVGPVALEASLRAAAWIARAADARFSVRTQGARCQPSPRSRAADRGEANGTGNLYLFLFHENLPTYSVIAAAAVH